jgi:hypothetical protein
LVKTKTAATPEQIDAMLAHLKARRVEAEDKHHKRGSSAEDRIKQAYDSAMRDGLAQAKAQAGLERLKASEQGLDAARVELIGLEAGADIAGQIAEKHIWTPKTKEEKESERKRINALCEAGAEIDGSLTRPVHSVETHGELVLALKALGEWLAEVEIATGEAKPKARWRRVLDPQGTIFSTKKRQGRSASSDRHFITKGDAVRLAKRIEKAVTAAQRAGDEAKNQFMAPILVALEKHPAACAEFMTLFFQRNTGARGEVNARRAALAEALARNQEQRRKVGQSEEQARKTLENDTAWIRSRTSRH